MLYGMTFEEYCEGSQEPTEQELDEEMMYRGDMEYEQQCDIGINKGHATGRVA